MDECPEMKCKPTQWSEWSDCSASCGDSAVMTKTRDCLCAPGVDEVECGCGDVVKTKPCREEPEPCPPREL